jgi:uncharacterized protein YecE (DUF72 family)
MQFGKVDSVEGIDLSLPPDNPQSVFGIKGKDLPSIYVGCAKWGRKDLKGFYPRGTKDELTYYSSQFNSIELNAVFYNYNKDQVEKWRDKTPKEFKFFPKINQRISHWGRLKDVSNEVTEYCDAMSLFEDRLGVVFLQLIENFRHEKNYDRLSNFIAQWPKAFPLAVEVRSKDWFADSAYYELLEEHGVSHIITDTAGRRDLLHMRLTSPKAFIRYVGANDPTDYSRLDDWVTRIGEWVEKGIEEIYFFIHQNIELESPLLTAYFIEQLNSRLGYRLKVPNKEGQKGLFD